MTFWKALKYAMMVAFAAILVVGVMMATDDTPTNSQPQSVPQTGSKFNF